MLKLELDRNIDKFLSRIPVKHSSQISKKIQLLRSNPKPHDAKQLIGYNLLRADSGEYRIIYQFDEEKLYIVLIGKRNDDEVYKLLKRQ